MEPRSKVKRSINDSKLKSKGSRRERHKESTRAALFDTSMKLFVERGYEKTTIDQIAEAADVSRGTVWNYFSKKEELLLYWIRTRQGKLKELIGEAQPGEGHVDRLFRIVDALAQVNEDERAEMRVILPIWQRWGPMDAAPYAAIVFAEALEIGKRKGGVRPDINSEVVGMMLRASFLDSLFRWASPKKRPFNLRTVLVIQLKTVLHGVDVSLQDE